MDSCWFPWLLVRSRISHNYWEAKSPFFGHLSGLDLTINLRCCGTIRVRFNLTSAQSRRPVKAVVVSCLWSRNDGPHLWLVVFAEKGHYWCSFLGKIYFLGVSEFVVRRCLTSHPLRMWVAYISVYLYRNLKHGALLNDKNYRWYGVFHYKCRYAQGIHWCTYSFYLAQRITSKQILPWYQSWTLTGGSGHRNC